MFDSNKVKLGIAPIAWTNDDMPKLGEENTFEQCISEMALAGFTGSEVGNKYPKDTQVLKKALGLRNIQIASAWFSSFVVSRPFEEVAKEFINHRDFLFEMGAKVIVVSEQSKSIQGKIDVPIFKGKPYFTDDEWKLLAEGLENLGKLAAEKNMKIVYHHHMGTGVQTAMEIERLMDMTSPDLVYLLFDTGHLVYSGEDPEYILKKYIHTAHD
jgi:inosose dehydratase